MSRVLYEFVNHEIPREAKQGRKRVRPRAREPDDESKVWDLPHESLQLAAPVVEDAGDAVPVMPSRRCSLVHPLTKFAGEIPVWIYDEHYGSMSAEARAALGLPADTIQRASFRHIVAMEHSVLSMTVKEKRRLYLLMRHLTGGGEHLTAVSSANPATASRVQIVQISTAARVEQSRISAEYLVPELGMTLGQLSTFHILLTRTHCTKDQNLQEMIQEHGALPLSHHIKIDVL
jgi:hypothetical protein